MILMSEAYMQHHAPWMLLAQALIGLREIPGEKHAHQVLTMWQAIGAAFRDDETPWCAAFVGYCLEQAGVRSTRSAAARSYLKWGKGANLDGGKWAVDGDLMRRTAPPTIACGAVVVLNRPGSSWSGHVGFYVKPTHFSHGPGVVLLGGNQDNQVKLSSYPLSRVIGVRWPTDRALTTKLAMEAGRTGLGGPEAQPGRSEA